MLEVSRTSMSHGSLIVSTLAAHLALTAPVEASAWPIEKNAIRVGGQGGTFGSAIIGPPLGSKVDAPLVSFYSELLSKQQRLSGEFERILFDNLQDLYVR
jgi:hypothetical protein